MVAGRRDVMDTLLDKGVMHGGTYNGNVQSMAAALAALDVLEADDGAVYRDLEARGTRLMQGLAALAQEAQGADAGAGPAGDLPELLHHGPVAAQLSRRRRPATATGAGVSCGAAGRGHPNQPEGQVLPVDGARRRDHRRDAGGGGPRDGARSHERHSPRGREQGATVPSRRPTRSISTWRRASSRPSSAPAAPARPPCCRSSPASSRRPEGRIIIGGRDVTGRRRRSAMSGWCSRATRCFRTCPCSTMWRFP